MVKLALANAYPRAYVTRRIGARRIAESLAPQLRRILARGLYFGPFASRRAAEAFLVPLLDLFRMRRCQIKIRRDPAFPGCIYSEMKMCLAPCFAGCTDEEYAREVAQVAAFLNSRGASYAGDLARERESASAALDFERAAALHHRLDKVEAVRRLVPELARPLDGLDAVMLQRAAEESTVAAFVLRGGCIADPFLLHFAELASQPRSAEQILRDVLEPSGPDPPNPMLQTQVCPQRMRATRARNWKITWHCWRVGSTVALARARSFLPRPSPLGPTGVSCGPVRAFLRVSPSASVRQTAACQCGCQRDFAASRA